MPRRVADEEAKAVDEAGDDDEDEHEHEYDEQNEDEDEDTDDDDGSSEDDGTDARRGPGSVTLAHLVPTMDNCDADDDDASQGLTSVQAESMAITDMRSPNYLEDI